MGFLNRICGRWRREEDATAFTETAILFPVLITLIMGCYDLGQGILMSQKTIGASQTIGDLVARDRKVDMATLDEIITAGRLAYEPYRTDTFGYDIISIEFDDIGNPQVLWRVTHNTQENDEAVTSARGIGSPGEGMVIVTTAFRYIPYFSKFMVDEIDMREIAFLRGRKSLTVVCDDCPA